MRKAKVTIITPSGEKRTFETRQAHLTTPEAVRSTFENIFAGSIQDLGWKIDSTVVE